MGADSTREEAVQTNLTYLFCCLFKKKMTHQRLVHYDGKMDMRTVRAKDVTANPSMINAHTSVWTEVCDLFNNGPKCTKGLHKSVLAIKIKRAFLVWP